MTKALKFLAALLFAIPLFAQAQAPRAGSPNYSQAELDQMLAPIALYPDALLSQVLMAATYPSEVVEAARWTRANGGLQGDTAVRSAQSENWDSSVISLVAFPQILQRMEENPGWTQALGDAFLAQEPQMMDSVQQLRQRAQAAGNLQSSEQMYVQQQGQTIVLQSASPQYVYVPYYDPLVAYGQWWWPAYRPVAWAPWPGYARPYRRGVSAGFWWGQPVGLSVNFFFGGVDWRHRQVRVLHPTAYYYRAPEVRRHFVSAPAVQRVQPRVERQVAPVAAPVAAQQRVRAQPEVRPQPQVRHEQVRHEQRPEQRARMPEAVAPQQPRAERPAPREERREQRREPREERGQKS